MSILMGGAGSVALTACAQHFNLSLHLNQTMQLDGVTSVAGCSGRVSFLFS